MDGLIILFDGKQQVSYKISFKKPPEIEVDIKVDENGLHYVDKQGIHDPYFVSP